MDTESTDDEGTFVPDEQEPEVAKSLDRAMSNIARALNSLHKLGVPQDLVLKLVESRAKFRWRSSIANDGIPTVSQLLDDPLDRKIRGSSSAARASQVQASKSKRKLNRINTDPEARAIMWPSDAPDAPRCYFDLMFDALACGVKTMKARREQATGNAPDAAPTDAAAPIATEVPLGCQLPFLPLPLLFGPLPLPLPLGSTGNSPTTGDRTPLAAGMLPLLK